MSITFSGVSATAAASRVFVEQQNVRRAGGVYILPRKILVLGQYNSGYTPTDNIAKLITSKEQAWTLYGRGSMLAIMIEKALDNSGGVPVYALPVADAGAGTASQGEIAIAVTTAAAGTISLYIGGVRIPVTVTAGMSADAIGEAIEAAINAKLDLYVTASNTSGTVTVTARNKGTVGNQVVIEDNVDDANEATPGGVTVTIETMGVTTAGATDPTLTTALAGLGNTWFTDIVSPYNDDTSLDAIEAAGDTRDGAGVNRPFACICGYTDTYANYITVLASRNSQWTTFVPVHGSSTPAYLIAAAAGAIFAKYQQATPGRPMKGLTIPGVLAGNDDLTYDERNAAVIAGGSHCYNQEDGTVTIGDLCTTRTTTAAGAETTDWMFSIIIPNLQYKRYSLEQTYLNSPFDRGVVAADGGGVGPTYVIRPTTVKSYAIQLVDDWVAKGLSTNRDTIVENIVAAINGSNPGRIDLLIPDVATAGLRIIACKLEWAFLV